MESVGDNKTIPEMPSIFCRKQVSGVLQIKREFAHMASHIPEKRSQNGFLPVVDKVLYLASIGSSPQAENVLIVLDRNSYLTYGGKVLL